MLYELYLVTAIPKQRVSIAKRPKSLRLRNKSHYTLAPSKYDDPHQMTLWGLLPRAGGEPYLLLF
jgi:hypothetical protein